MVWRSGGWASARVWALVCARVSVAPSPSVLSASWGSAIAGLPPAEEAAWKAELVCGGGGLAGTSTPSSLEGDWVEATSNSSMRLRRSAESGFLEQFLRGLDRADCVGLACCLLRIARGAEGSRTFRLSLAEIVTSK